MHNWKNNRERDITKILYIERLSVNVHRQQQRIQFVSEDLVQSELIKSLSSRFVVSISIYIDIFFVVVVVDDDEITIFNSWLNDGYCVSPSIGWDDTIFFSVLLFFTF